jgi:hypothetical protein
VLMAGMLETARRLIWYTIFQNSERHKTWMGAEARLYCSFSEPLTHHVAKLPAM